MKLLSIVMPSVFKVAIVNYYICFGVYRYQGFQLFRTFHLGINYIGFSLDCKRDIYLIVSALLWVPVLLFYLSTLLG